MAMPATNTALLLMDPYLTARTFSTPLTADCAERIAGAEVCARRARRQS